ncbi:hypothetical protein SAMN04488511_111125 [Pedobacter suwonensis]|uniref:Uncharacterized protein n=1 Tax=Pedobacter suwonensis TaxID=332999 RepID=A0A1I0TLV8_9SPHI|nr:hypothetical protein SAMN04488511_111125 [Pedobacter suwonensis]
MTIENHTFNPKTLAATVVSVVLFPVILLNLLLLNILGKKRTQFK